MKELKVAYRIACGAQDIEARARALAVEQSIEMPPGAVGDERVRAEVLGAVDAIQPIEGGDFRVTLGLSVPSTGLEGGQLLNMLFGNSSLQPDVILEDFDLPTADAARFGGPAEGLVGLRRRLGVAAGALTCSALKPLGSSSRALADLAARLAAGGIDVIKDDHGLADQAFAPFAERVRAVQGALRREGLNAHYAPTLSGGPISIAAQRRILQDEGVEMALVAPMICGLGTLHELARSRSGLALIAHPAMGGAARIAPPALLGKLFRLCGADATIFPNHGGRFSYAPETCASLAAAARNPWHGLNACLPVPAGGMHPGRVAEMLDFYGGDVMLLIGGALLESPLGVERAARDFVEAVRGGGR
ncbi:MAG: hypothetical protein KDG55_17520 [Rhodocyclaceae bacterium]|nr:hypothetical protein [Rhodocyclaceae bacterium]